MHFLLLNSVEALVVCANFSQALLLFLHAPLELFNCVLGSVDQHVLGAVVVLRRDASAVEVPPVQEALRLHDGVQVGQASAETALLATRRKRVPRGDRVERLAQVEAINRLALLALVKFD